MLPLEYGVGHPTERHPVSDVTNLKTKAVTPMNCLTCHQPHAGSGKRNAGEGSGAQHGVLPDLPQQSSGSEIHRQRQIWEVNSDVSAAHSPKAKASAGWSRSYSRFFWRARRYADKKKAAPTAEQKIGDQRSKGYFDISKIVWPNPPAIARIKFRRFVHRREGRSQPFHQEE